MRKALRGAPQSIVDAHVVHALQRLDLLILPACQQDTHAGWLEMWTGRV